MAARLDLWNIGALEDLTGRAQASKRLPSGRSKTQRAAKKIAQLLRKNECARAAHLAGNLGVAKANEDTIKVIAPLFPTPGVVEPTNLMAYYGPTAAPLLTGQPPLVI